MPWSPASVTVTDFQSPLSRGASQSIGAIRECTEELLPALPLKKRDLRIPRVDVYITRRGNAFQVNCSAFRPRIRKSFRSQQEAVAYAAHLRWQLLSGIRMTNDDYQQMQAAKYLVATTQGPAQGLTLLSIVQWGLAHYKKPDIDKPISEYAADFLGRKELKLEENSMDELRRYIGDFVQEFGESKPEEVSSQQLETYLAVKTSRHYREKPLRAYFRWLTGAVCKNITCLKNPPLEESPFNYIAWTEYIKKHPTEILLPNEVLAVLEAAKASGVLPWFVWNVFTGMRPEAEAKPFWELPEHGWNRIDFDRGMICVTEDLEKTGTRIRDITIQPNLREWLLWMKRTEQLPVYSRHKIRAIFRAVIPKKQSKDILRHTFISCALKIMKDREVCYEAATSMEMIQKHYRRQVVPSEAEAFWAITPKTLGL